MGSKQAIWSAFLLDLCIERKSPDLSQQASCQRFVFRLAETGKVSSEFKESVCAIEACLEMVSGLSPLYSCRVQSHRLCSPSARLCVTAKGAFQETYEQLRYCEYDDSLVFLDESPQPHSGRVKPSIGCNSTRVMVADTETVKTASDSQRCNLRWPFSALSMRPRNLHDRGIPFMWEC